MTSESFLRVKAVDCVDLMVRRWCLFMMAIETSATKEQYFLQFWTTIDSYHSAACWVSGGIKSFVSARQASARREFSARLAMQRQSFLFSWDSTWPPYDKGLWRHLLNQTDQSATWVGQETEFLSLVHSIIILTTSLSVGDKRWEKPSCAAHDAATWSSSVWHKFYNKRRNEH